MFRAERVYDDLIRQGEHFEAGARIELEWTLRDGLLASWRLFAEVLPNSVWRRGRLFLRCPHCQRRATRLYVPIRGLEPRCRRCWGLAYASQSHSYRPVDAPGGLWRALCCLARDDRRERRQRDARARYAARRAFLRSPS